MRNALLVGLLAGCSGGSDLVFEEANNYTFSGVLAVESMDVQAETDATIDWSAITTDVRGRDFDGSPEQILLVEFTGSQASILEGIDNNTLVQADVQESYLVDDPEGGSILLSELEIIGNQFEVDSFNAVNPDERNWLVTIANTTGEFDVLMSKFIVPTDASTNTTVALEDGCAGLTINDLDLSSAPPISAKADTDVILDWSGITTDVHGNAFNKELADNLLIARFDVSSPAEIEDVFLRLDDEAAELYSFQSFGLTSAALNEATNDAGAAFTGFTSDGVWLVGLQCSTCLNPVPLLIGVVEVL